MNANLVNFVFVIKVKLCARVAHNFSKPSLVAYLLNLCWVMMTHDCQSLTYFALGLIQSLWSDSIKYTLKKSCSYTFSNCFCIDNAKFCCKFLAFFSFLLKMTFLSTQTLLEIYNIQGWQLIWRSFKFFIFLDWFSFSFSKTRQYLLEW